ncbi:hypothetical protein VTL71DRAFT_14674 [Oculimacula yallundae]|uniref:Ribosomal protein s17 n=1 Tax=Oculimacula yallundae TaxID=86028 RepID=A0ABR4CLE4_9HELO
MVNPTLLVLAFAGLIDCRSVFDTKHMQSSHLDTRHMHGVLDGLHVRDSRHAHAHLHNRQNNNGERKKNNDNANNNNDASGTILVANALQTGSFNDGSVNGKQNAGQSASKTSKNNFINFCSGKTLTNGLQVIAGSCNGIPMGDLPSKKNMVSSIITFPQAGDTSIKAKTTFKIEVQTSNLVAGSFTNAAATYYAGPQFLSNGQVVGHTHVTVQDMGGSLNPTKALDATQFVFFKGINDVGNGKGLLSATVTGGLNPGNYRVCTITSASNHQPVLMPVAQRGGQDDCTKFTILDPGNNGGNTGGNTGGNNGNGGDDEGDEDDEDDGNNGGTAASTKLNAAGSSSSADSTSKAESTATTKTRRGGNGGGKTTTKSFATVAPFQNTTLAQTTSTKAAAGNGNGNGGKGNGGNGGKGNGGNGGNGGKGNGGNGGNGGKGNGGNNNNNNNGGKATPKPVVVEATTTAKATVAPSIVAVETTKKGDSGNNGKPAFTGKANGGKQTTVIVVHKVVVVKTFFKFVFSLGGLPPAVDKKGNSFVVIGDLFDDFPSACAAACGHQYTKCISFSGPGFSFKECTSQRNKCGNVASSASAPPAPETVTATVTVPPAASVTGSVISEVTLTTTVQASQTAPTLAGAEAIATSLSASECVVVTNTVYVDPPSATNTPISAATFITSKLFPNATIAVTSSTSSAAVVLPTAGSAALGGIAAPEITDSGDSKRPFTVKGNTFVEKSAAIQRSCDVQFNACANAFNGGSAKDFNFADCKKQQDACVAAGV